MRDRDRNVAGAGANVEHVRLGHFLGQAQTFKHDVLRFRPGNKHGRRDLKGQREEFLAADQVSDGAALDAAADQLPKALPCFLGCAFLKAGVQLDALATETVALQSQTNSLRYFAHLNPAIIQRSCG